MSYVGHIGLVGQQKEVSCTGQSRTFMSPAPTALSFLYHSNLPLFSTNSTYSPLSSHPPTLHSPPILLLSYSPLSSHPPTLHSPPILPTLTLLLSQATGARAAAPVRPDHGFPGDKPAASEHQAGGGQGGAGGGAGPARAPVLRLAGRPRPPLPARGQGPPALDTHQ